MTRAFVAILFLLGCSEAPPTPPTEEPETETETETETEVEPQPEAEIDLLPTHATALAVSSTTPSLRSGPRFLLDGSFDTPWASRTGDDAAFIEVRLPTDVRVQRLELTAGFTKVDGRHDRFLQNLRITRVRVLHDGELVKTVSLDPESRELQPIDVEGNGGVWRIEIAETIAGTMPGYREVCVSELRVMGHGAPTTDDGPELYLGGLEGLRINDVRQARADFAAMARGIPEGTFGEWWDRATTAMHAFPMRCAFPRLRRAIAQKASHVFELSGQRAEANETIADVACPGPGLSGAAYEILGDIREEAEARLDDTELDMQIALGDVQLLFGEWAHHCEERVAPLESDREEERNYNEAFFKLDTELERHVR